METLQPVIINLNTLSDSFPTIAEDSISRENYIAHIESSLSHNRVICANGVEDGVGVTTLLALFAKKHAQECVSLFNSHYSTAFQTIGFIEHTIAKQLNYYLYNEICDVTDGLINRIKWKATRKLNNSRNRLYFIFDGYNNLTTECKNSLRKLLDDLYTIPNSYFIFSGEESEIEYFFPKEVAIGQVDVLPFSESETSSYFTKEFPDIEIDNLSAITKISRGIGSRMVVLKEQLKATDSINEYLLNDINENTDLLEDVLENITNSTNATDVVIFALLTYSEIPLSVNAISSIVKISDVDIHNFISRYNNLVFVSPDEILKIRSSIFHKYLKQKLINRKRFVVENLVLHITKFDNVNQSFQALPNLLREAHNERAILEYIDSDIIRSFVKRTASQAIVNEHCDLGFSASSKYPAEY